jgi:hypothetical protein
MSVMSGDASKSAGELLALRPRATVTRLERPLTLRLLERNLDVVTALCERRSPVGEEGVEATPRRCTASPASKTW